MEKQYPGNPVLPDDAKARVEATFRQTLQLYQEGKSTDVLVGCDFILKLDPMFKPASELMEKVQNPDSPVDITPYLETYLHTQALSEDDLMIQAIEAFNQKDWDKAQELAKQILLQNPNHPEAKDLLRRLEEQVEIQFYIQQFVKQAEDALKEGKIAQAFEAVEKGLQLDGENPELLALKKQCEAQSPEATQTFTLEEMPVEAPTEPPPMEVPPSPEAVTPTESEFELQIEAPVESMPAPEPEVSEENEQILALIKEGQEAYDKGDYQEAIDIWSRIYLIDMSHEEAGNLIEKAKEAMKKQERELEQIFTEATALFDGGNLVEAEAKFQEILKAQPHHVAARNYLQKIQEAKAEKAPSQPEAVPEAKPEVEEYPAEAPAPPPEAPLVEEKKRKGPLTMVIGILAMVIVAVLALKFFVLNKPEAKKEPIITADILLDQAKNYYKLGKVDKALETLKKIPPSDPLYGEALSLIEIYRKTPTPTTETSKNNVNLENWQTAIQKGLESYQSGVYLEAYNYLDQAQAVKPLEGDGHTVYMKLTNFVQEYKEAERLSNAQKYEEAINMLNALSESYPQSLDLQELLIRCYYNQGVIALRNNQTAKAKKAFQAVLEKDPNDTLAKKNLTLAQRYHEMPKDLLYKTYTRYLALR